MIFVDRMWRISARAMAYVIRANGKCYAAAAIRYGDRWGLMMDQVVEAEDGAILDHVNVVRADGPTWHTPGEVVQAAMGTARSIERAERARA